MEMARVLSVTDLSIRYHIGSGWLTAVDGVTVSVDRGETLCLVGESGSGKTSIALSVPRLLPPVAQVSGKVEVDGREIYGASEEVVRQIRKKKVSFIFQDAVGSLVPTVTVGKQLMRTIAFRTDTSDKATCAPRARNLMLDVGLVDTERVWNAYPAQLSGGMCQRVMIALALSVEPSLVIADEPTSGLDALTTERVLDLIANQLQPRFGFAMLFVTHDLRIGKRVSDRVAVMKEGKVIEHRATREFFESPEREYSRQLIASAAKLSL